MAMSRTGIVAGAVLIVALGGLAGCTKGRDDGGQPVANLAATNAAILDSVRMATERFQDVAVALAEGYIADPTNTCETSVSIGRAPELGAMGIHYFRPAILGITGPPNPRVSGTGTHTDFLTPGVLIYEPQEDGSLKLVAVENLVFADAWKAAGNAEPPAFLGVPYDFMIDDPATPADEGHHFDPHFDRHVWLYRENPNGMFAQFNPNVSCAHHQGGGHGHPALSPG